MKPTEQSHTFASRTSQPANQSLQKRVPAPSEEEFQNIFSLALKKDKTPTYKPTTQTADTYEHDNWTPEKEAYAQNKGLPKAVVTSFYSSFVL